jgi:glycyl-tRNA synthetase beta chain
MTTNKNLLVELLVEELPPKSLKKISEAFATALTRELSNEGLLESESITTSYASPRRLAAHITNVREKAPTKRVRKKLMPVSVAFEEGGKPSAALRKKIDKENFSIDNLIRAMEGNTEYVFLDF